MPDDTKTLVERLRDRGCSMPDCWDMRHTAADALERLEREVKNLEEDAEMAEQSHAEAMSYEVGLREDALRDSEGEVERLTRELNGLRSIKRLVDSYGPEHAEDCECYECENVALRAEVGARCAEIVRLRGELKAANGISLKAIEEGKRLRVEPVKCPVCDGHRTVSRPPWVAGDQLTWDGSSFDAGPWPCQACGGHGYIARAALAEGGDDD